MQGMITVNLHAAGGVSTWHLWSEAKHAQASSELASNAEQIKGEHIRARGSGPELLVPEHKSGGLGVAKFNLVNDANIHLCSRVMDFDTMHALFPCQGCVALCTEASDRIDAAYAWQCFFMFMLTCSHHGYAGYSQLV